jgi:hypothetical protein
MNPLKSFLKNRDFQFLRIFLTDDCRTDDLEAWNLLRSEKGFKGLTKNSSKKVKHFRS